MRFRIRWMRKVSLYRCDVTAVAVRWGVSLQDNMITSFFFVIFHNLGLNRYDIARCLFNIYKRRHHKAIKIFMILCFSTQKKNKYYTVIITRNDSWLAIKLCELCICIAAMTPINFFLKQTAIAKKTISQLSHMIRFSNTMLLLLKRDGLRGPNQWDILTSKIS